MKRICVFCGSRPGGTEAFRAEAAAMGTALAARGLTLVYGGGGVGLMGALADAVLDGGGAVIGVIPDRLASREVHHRNVADMRFVPTMHARKALMAELADAFVALPGGLGTFEELFEVWTWGQLGLHDKPLAVVNVSGYFDPLLSLVDHAVDAGFVLETDRRRLLAAPTSSEILDALLAHSTVGAGER
jgi:uncharacterized protein (TIGR00730 family)